MTMSTEFQYDVFLSHSAKDKPRELSGLSESLRADGLKALSNFGFRVSDFRFAQPGLSANASGSDWAQLESGTFRGRAVRCSECAALAEEGVGERERADRMNRIYRIFI
jgi:hypothetical protein